MGGTFEVPSFMTTVSDMFSRQSLVGIKLHENVTEISDNALRYNKRLNTVEIPANSKLITIGNNAFNGCVALESFTFPVSITKVGSHVFLGCTALKTVVLHDDITSIADYAFSTCTNLTNIQFPKKLESIGPMAFYGCTSLTGTLEIPDTVVQNDQFSTEVGETANPFTNCTGLTGLIIGRLWNDFSILQLPSVSRNFKSVINRHIESQDLSTISVNTANTLSNTCKVYIHPSNTGFRDNIGKFNVTDSSRIRDIAVYYSKQFTLSNGTVDYSFDENADKGSLAINVTGDLENFTIDSCPWNAQLPFIYFITLADNITKLGDFSLTNSNISNITLPNTCTKIGSSVFKGCTNLTTINQTASISEIGASAFDGCSKLTSIDLNCTSIPDSAFRNCSALENNPMTKITTTVGNNAFENCALFTSYKLNNTISLGDYAFSGVTGVTDNTITLPDTLTNIGANVFSGNATTVDVINGAPLQTVNVNAFSGMTALTNIYGDSNNTQLVAAAGDKFKNINTLAMIIPFTYNGREAYPITSDKAVKCGNNTLDMVLKDYASRIAALESK